MLPRFVILLKIISSAMSFIYIFLGLAVLIQGRAMLALPIPAHYILGIVLCAYGSYRVYQTLRRHE